MMIIMRYRSLRIRESPTGPYAEDPILTPEQATAMVEIAKSKAECTRQDGRVDLMREMEQNQQLMVTQFMKTLGGTIAQVNQAKDAQLKRALKTMTSPRSV